MIQLLARAGLAILMSVPVLVGSASLASAQDTRFEFGIETGEPRGYYRRGEQDDDDQRDEPRGYYRRAEPRDYYRGDDRRGCSPGMAESIARDYGLRKARTVAVTPRRVVVEGRVRGAWDRMVFANARGCPLLRR